MIRESTPPRARRLLRRRPLPGTNRPPAAQSRLPHQPGHLHRSPQGALRLPPSSPPALRPAAPRRRAPAHQPAVTLTPALLPTLGAWTHHRANVPARPPCNPSCRFTLHTTPNDRDILLRALPNLLFLRLPPHHNRFQPITCSSLHRTKFHPALLMSGGEETWLRPRLRHRHRAKAAGNSYSLVPTAGRASPRLYKLMLWEHRSLSLEPRGSIHRLAAFSCRIFRRFIARVALFRQ